MSAAVHPPSPHASDEGYALVAATAIGPVRLSWGRQVGNATQAAVALRALGDWLDGLEDWLAPEQGLDWWPIDDAAEALRRVDVDWVTAQAFADASTGDEGVRLSLPWPALHELAEPAGQLGLRWPALPAELLLARQPLPPEDPGRLEPGAVLLLEDSFEPAWTIQLRRTDSVQGRPLICDGRLAWPTHAPQRRRELPSPRLEVRMALPTPVPVPLLTGWHARDTAFPADALATLHLVATGGREERLAEGQLLPWGRGHALRVTRVLADELSTARSWT